MTDEGKDGWIDPDEDFEGGLFPPEDDEFMSQTSDNSQGNDCDCEECQCEEPSFFFPRENVPTDSTFEKKPASELPEEEQPIHMRATEAEKLYSNLLIKTDFEHNFIQEMLEFEPNEEEKERINELCRIRERSETPLPPEQPLGNPPPMGGGEADFILL
jgi:hypothetical protein